MICFTLSARESRAYHGRKALRHASILSVVVKTGACSLRRGLESTSNWATLSIILVLFFLLLVSFSSLNSSSFYSNISVVGSRMEMSMKTGLTKGADRNGWVTMCEAIRTCSISVQIATLRKSSSGA